MDYLTFKVIIPVIVVSVFGMVAAATDLWKYKVYNWLTLPLFLAGLTYHLIIGGLMPAESGYQIGAALGWNGLGGSFTGAAFGFFILLVPWLMGGVGAGDVKLMTAVGAWLGLVMTFWLFMVTAILQGICALLLVLLRGSLGETWGRMNLIFYRVAMFGEYLGKEGNVEEGLASPNRRSRMIPFGAMLVLGLCAVAIGAWLFPAIAQKFSRP